MPWKILIVLNFISLHTNFKGISPNDAQEVGQRYTVTNRYWQQVLINLTLLCIVLSP